MGKDWIIDEKMGVPLLPKWNLHHDKTQSEQTAKQSPDTFMWIYAHSLVHYVQLTRNETTVASVMGRNQEWKKLSALLILTPSGRISASIIVRICPGGLGSSESRLNYC